MAWTVKGNLKGPQGPIGNPGPQGPQGIQGPQGESGMEASLATVDTKGLMSPADKVNANAVPGIDAELSAFLTPSTPIVSQEELSQTFVIAFGSMAGVSEKVNRDMTIWTAPFPCKITWASLVFDYWTQPVPTETDYVLMDFRHRDNDTGVYNTFVGKNTQPSSGFENITSRKAWPYATAPWQDVEFAENDTLLLAFRCYGTHQISFPVTVTFRYVPL